jgi:hypothetical protein
LHEDTQIFQGRNLSGLIRHRRVALQVCGKAKSIERCQDRQVSLSRLITPEANMTSAQFDICVA